MGMLFNQIYGNQTEEDFVYKISESRVKATREVMEQQLAKNTYLAEEKFTAADCCIGQQPAHKRAIENGDPDLVPLSEAPAPAKSLL
ncbi:hypothetical protein AbraCBS73388_006200 [Aspergillus brasiliensis]|uniref:Glutathione S-transferase C-terminal domain-containing protein n=1 Tax=Aspergillus brasiliensis TaxID=319629 RepID=A0A9W5Z387_9EURO|nr:hypothetical protein AbraCBS73388_006200 [Aspergillus brasiliensis]